MDSLPEEVFGIILNHFDNGENNSLYLGLVSKRFYAATRRFKIWHFVCQSLVDEVGLQRAYPYNPSRFEEFKYHLDILNWANKYISYLLKSSEDQFLRSYQLSSLGLRLRSHFSQSYFLERKTETERIFCKSIDDALRDNAILHGSYSLYKITRSYKNFPLLKFFSILKTCSSSSFHEIFQNSEELDYDLTFFSEELWEEYNRYTHQMKMEHMNKNLVVTTAVRDIIQGFTSKGWKPTSDFLFDYDDNLYFAKYDPRTLCVSHLKEFNACIYQYLVEWYDFNYSLIVAGTKIYIRVSLPDLTIGQHPYIYIDCEKNELINVPNFMGLHFGTDKLDTLSPASHKDLVQACYHGYLERLNKTKSFGSGILDDWEVATKTIKPEVIRAYKLFLYIIEAQQFFDKLGISFDYIEENSNTRHDFEQIDSLTSYIEIGLSGDKSEEIQTKMNESEIPIPPELNTALKNVLEDQIPSLAISARIIFPLAPISFTRQDKIENLDRLNKLVSSTPTPNSALHGIKVLDNLMLEAGILVFTNAFRANFDFTNIGVVLGSYRQDSVEMCKVWLDKDYRHLPVKSLFRITHPLNPKTFDELYEYVTLIEISKYFRGFDSKQLKCYF